MQSPQENEGNNRSRAITVHLFSGQSAAGPPARTFTRTNCSFITLFQAAMPIMSGILNN